MALHLAEIAQAVTPGSHAVLLLDQAGWHVSAQTEGAAQHHPAAAARESARTEPGGEHLAVSCRENWISNRVFTSYTDILDHCCAAWNKLIDQPWTIMSIGLRDWAHGF